METPLTQREFDTWKVDDAAFKTEIREHIQRQVELNLKTEGRLSTLESTKSNRDNKTLVWATLLSGGTGTMLHALMHFFGK